jgi:hypothetical protein
MHAMHDDSMLRQSSDVEKEALCSPIINERNSKNGVEKES